MHDYVLDNTAEGEAGGGNDAHWTNIHRIRAAVAAGKVRKPRMTQVEHKLKRDGVEIDNSSHIRRGGDLRVN